MNLINASNKIGRNLSILRFRMEALLAHKAELQAELRPIEKANSALSDQLDEIDMEFADTDLLDEIEDVEDKISAINYAFENALGELDTGIYSSK